MTDEIIRGPRSHPVREIEFALGQSEAWVRTWNAHVTETAAQALLAHRAGDDAFVEWALRRLREESLGLNPDDRFCAQCGDSFVSPASARVGSVADTHCASCLAELDGCDVEPMEAM
jgi:hypothetical protein